MIASGWDQKCFPSVLNISHGIVDKYLNEKETHNFPVGKLLSCWFYQVKTHLEFLFLELNFSITNFFLNDQNTETYFNLTFFADNSKIIN